MDNADDSHQFFNSIKIGYDTIISVIFEVMFGKVKYIIKIILKLLKKAKNNIHGCNTQIIEIYDQNDNLSFMIIIREIEDDRFEYVIINTKTGEMQLGRL